MYFFFIPQNNYVEDFQWLNHDDDDDDDDDDDGKRGFNQGMIGRGGGTMISSVLL